jgi:hypothetical protein
LGKVLRRLKGEISGGESSVTGGIFGRRKKLLRWPDGEGPPVSEREGKAGYRFGKGFLAAGCVLFWAEPLPLRPFYIFFLSSFFFSIFLFLL